MSLSFIFKPFSRIIEGKEKDDPKTVPLKIFAKDIGNCAYVSSSSSPDGSQQYHYHFCECGQFLVFSFLDVQAKTLAVSNMDTTSDVIRMALLQFGISVRDQTAVLAQVQIQSLNTKI